MARLRYRFGEDQLPVAPPPLNVEEDGDGWWSGIQLNFAAIPIAATLAAVVLSASLAFGYQQQTEDIVPQPPAPTVIEEDSWQVYTPPYLPPAFLYLPDPEELPTGSLYGVSEEGVWVPSRYCGDIRLLWLPTVDDELPVFVPSAPITEEDFWSVYTPPYLPVRLVYLPDPEELPAGSLIAPAVEEGTYIPIFRPRRRP